MLFFDQSHAGKLTSVPEFQAVILAGNKASLYPLAVEDNLPKALLPIANRPMIAYTLQWLEQAGIQDIIVAACPSSSAKLTHYLRNVYEGSATIEIVVVDEFLGTAEVLTHISNRLFYDFIVMTCDSITLTPPQRFLDAHRTWNASLSAYFFSPAKSEGGGGSTKDAAEWPLYVGIDSAASSRLLYLKPGDHVKDHLSIPRSLLRQFNRVNLVTSLRDAHIYVCRHWVLDLLAQDKELISFQRDVLPLLVKAQYRASVRDRYGIPRLMAAAAAESRNRFSQSVAEWSTTWKEGEKEDPLNPHQLRCHVFIDRDQFTGRADTIPNYCDVNKQLAKHASAVDSRISATADVNPRSQVGSDSMVGKETKMDERCSVKKSVIGAHCVIGKYVKIVNSVLMDYVTVEDGAKLDGCVICTNAKVLSKAQLKDCEISAGLVIDPNTQAKNERIVSTLVDADEDSPRIEFA
ncbi:Translation initiation factor eIF-2B subunit gamma [Dimargaris xerosporica]|nr:Translation initiation factor eIF-2B subunit gamma [Dimargaris xerosporica]